MAIPDSLAEKIEGFRRRAILPDYAHGLFQQVSWISVFLGQNAVPEAWDPRAEVLPEAELATRLEGIHQRIARDAAAMPDHLDFIARSGAAFEALGETAG